MTTSETGSGEPTSAAGLGQLDPEAPVTAVILTRDEEKHLERCISSIRELCAHIIVVDSQSQDRTRDIAERLGAEVHVRPWPGKYAAQFNFGIAQAGQRTPWMLRMDADEYLTPALCEEIRHAIQTASDEVTGLIVPRLVYFQGHPIRHGGFYPQLLLRVWRAGLASCESRMMDEHMVLSHGRAERLRADLVDDNKNDIFWWTDKHNRYARREAADLLNLKYGWTKAALGKTPAGGQAARKRLVKEVVYARLPLGFRALLYFFYRFVLLAGFLDNPRVWVFHFLQAAWYRTLVDVNVGEFETAVGAASPDEQLRFLEERWGVRF